MKSTLFRIASIIFRALAILTAVVVVMLSFKSAASWRIDSVVSVLDKIVPNALSGSLVVVTPLGGAFRGDLAIFSVACFMLDWLCLRFASRLR